MFADLRGRRCVVVGGGAVAQRKVASLLTCGARVTLISPTVAQRLSQWVREGTIRHLARRFRAGDVRGAWLVCACTDDPQINEAAALAGRRRGVFTNVVDQPRQCSFIAPAVARRGSLTIAVSTTGASPSLAKALRDDVARLLGDGYAPMAHLLSRLRPLAHERLPRYAERKRYFHRLVNGNVFRLVRDGQALEARHEALRLLCLRPTSHKPRATSRDL